MSAGEGIAIIVIVLTVLDNFVRIFTSKNIWEKLIRIAVAILVVIVFWNYINTH